MLSVISQTEKVKMGIFICSLCAEPRCTTMGEEEWWRDRGEERSGGENVVFLCPFNTASVFTVRLMNASPIGYLS